MTLIVGKDYKFIFKIPHIGNYDNSLIFGYLMPLSTIFSCIVHLFYFVWINASYSYCIAKETSKVVLRTKDRCTMASYTENGGHI
jgi:hypothetical protein